jgi:peptidyl-prolyl cis-trans isomerase SurA
VTLLPRLLILLFALTVPLGAAGVEIVDRIVVVVNEALILESEVAEELDLYLEAEPINMPPGPRREAALAELRDAIIEGLVGRLLMDQATTRLGIIVEEPEVEQQIAEYARMNNLGVDQLLGELARQGISQDEFRSDMRDQIRQYRLFQMEIGTKIDVTEDMLLQRYREEYGDAGEDPEYHLRVIVLRLPEGDAAGAVEVKARAVALRDEILGGASFEEIATEHSEDPGSASRGGSFGKVRPRSMIPEFRAAVEGLPLHEVSEPVEFQAAIWLLQVHRITDGSATSFESVRDALFNQLYREHEEREISMWLEREKVRAHIEYLH